MRFGARRREDNLKYIEGGDEERNTNEQPNPVCETARAYNSSRTPSRHDAAPVAAPRMPGTSPGKRVLFA